MDVGFAFEPFEGLRVFHPGVRPTARSVAVEGEPVEGVRIHESGWSRPVRLGFNTTAWEDSPYITRDGRWILYFYHPARDLIAAAPKVQEWVVERPKQAVALGFDGRIMISPRPFKERFIHPISANDSPAMETCPYGMPDGRLMVVSNRESYERMRDVPVKIYLDRGRLDVPWPGEVSNPHYCAASDELWFDCPGDDDICVMPAAQRSEFKGRVVKAPSPINARDRDTVHDAQVFLTDDCLELYFSSDRRSPGVFQVFRTRRNAVSSQTWQDPEVFISAPFTVAEVSMTADKKEMVFSALRWTGGRASIDVLYSRRTFAE